MSVRSDVAVSFTCALIRRKIGVVSTHEIGLAGSNGKKVVPLNEYSRTSAVAILMSSAVQCPETRLGSSNPAGAATTSAARQFPWSLNGSVTPRFGPSGASGDVGGRTVDSPHAATISASTASDKIGFRLSFESMLTPSPARLGNGMVLPPIEVDSLRDCCMDAMRCGSQVAPCRQANRSIAMESGLGAVHSDPEVKACSRPDRETRPKVVHPRKAISLTEGVCSSAPFRAGQ